jgi:RluA family pseudouridine synthase
MPARFQVLLRTDALVAVSKPVGIATIAERDLSVTCLRSELERQLGEKVFVVHRLDKEVSGLVLFALHAESHRELSMAFERREVKKTYLALVHGRPAWASLLADQPIFAFGSGRMGVDAWRGKASTTELRVLRRGEAHALVEARPITGRRHQIRVHLHAAGHAIAGDLRYGERALQERYPRLMLHSLRIELPASFGAGPIECAPPSDFEAELALHLPPV